jgi:hypothetical protein
MKLAGLIVFIGVLAIIYAQIYSIWDVVARQRELSFVMRTVWLVALFVFPVLATVAYLRMGPGAAHWPPWDVSED